jgi:hypothetical protein
MHEIVGIGPTINKKKIKKNKIDMSLKFGFYMLHR